MFEVLAAADRFEVTTAVQQCCDFLKREFIQLRINLHNYCLLSTVADRHGLRDLQEAAAEKVASLYVDVYESEEFLSNVVQINYSASLVEMTSRHPRRRSSLHR